ncbi:MAG: hypothetical protein FWD64_13180 [Acidobacteriaceae bacterium]|nr:hypothetical protein [Acidobacteriaceae bacterium]
MSPLSSKHITKGVIHFGCAALAATSHFGAIISPFVGAFDDTAADFLDKVIGGDKPNCEDVCRKAFRKSLNCIHEKNGSDFEGWFDNWAVALRYELSTKIQPSDDPMQFDCRFRELMKILDAQGHAYREANRSDIASINPDRLKLRDLPDDLFELLKSGLQEHFWTTFRDLLLLPEGETARNEFFIDAHNEECNALKRINAVTQKSADIIDVHLR